QRTCCDPGLIWEHICRDAIDPAGHFDCRAPGKGQEHYPSRIGAQHDEMRHTVRKRVRLAGASTGDNEKRRGIAMLDGMALFWVKPDEVGRCCHADERRIANPTTKHAFWA